MWNGEWYRRKRASNWRNARTGDIKFAPSKTGRTIRLEPKKMNIYGFDDDIPQQDVHIRKAQRKFGDF